MKKSIKAAIQNIANFGDTDIFPFSLEQYIFFDKPNLVQKALEDLDKNFKNRLEQNPPENINTLAPVGYTGFRWAAQIDPLWNAYYLALIIQIGPFIEKARIPIKDKSVFSYRFVTPNSAGKIFDEKINWHLFMQTTIEEAEKHDYVLVCDISDFYSRIYHHRIENALKWLKEMPDIVKKIISVLEVFSGTVSYGLPVGGPASRLLAELALNNTDKLLRAENIRFCRFVDDYRIFCHSKEDAYQRLIFLSEKLFNEGLSLQKNKTRILTSKEYKDEVNLLLRSNQVDEDNVTEEDKLMRLALNFDPYSETSVEDYERLKKEASKVDIAGILARELEKTRIDPIITKRAIGVLRVLKPDTRNGIILSLLQPVNLNTLAPIFTRLMTVLRGLYIELDEDTQNKVDEALIKLIQDGSHIIKVELNLAYLIQVLRRRSTQVKELIFNRIFKTYDSPLIRREIILAMADWGHNHWVTDLKKRFNGLGKWERRSFIVASYFLTDEGRHWRRHNKSSFDASENMVKDWFQDRFQENPSVPQ